jgi:hypothetical protein
MAGQSLFAPVGIRKKGVLEQADDFSAGRGQAAGDATFKKVVLVESGAHRGACGRVIESYETDLRKPGAQFVVVSKVDIHGDDDFIRMALNLRFESLQAATHRLYIAALDEDDGQWNHCDIIP